MRLKEEKQNEDISSLNTKHDEILLSLTEDINKKKVELKELEAQNRQEVIEVESLHNKE